MYPQEQLLNTVITAVVFILLVILSIQAAKFLVAWANLLLLDLVRLLKVCHRVLHKVVMYPRLRLKRAWRNHLKDKERSEALAEEDTILPTPMGSKLEDWQILQQVSTPTPATMSRSKFKVGRIVPSNALGSAKDGSVIIQQIKRQMARDCVEEVLKKMHFEEHMDGATGDITFSGVVYIASEKEWKGNKQRLAMQMQHAQESATQAAMHGSAAVAQAAMRALENSPGPVIWGADLASQRESEMGQLFAAAAAKDEEYGSKVWLESRQIYNNRKREQSLRNTAPGTVVRFLLTERGELIMSSDFWKTGDKFQGEVDETDSYPQAHVLVDGDIVAYRCAATCDGRYYEVGGERFLYSKDAKKHADQKGIPNSEITSGYEPEPVDAALHNCAVTIDNINQHCLHTLKVRPIIKIFLSGQRNFRYDIFPEYKANRKDQRRPHWLEDCKQYLVEQFGAFRFEGFEADDLIGMTVTQLRPSLDDEDKPEIIISSCDKDFTQLGGFGVRMHDFTAGNKMWEVTEQEAMAYFYKQILMGDKSDGIPGLHRVGNQTALKILSTCEEERDYYNAVVMEYKKRESVTTEEAVEMVDLRGKLLFLLREEGKLWEPPPPRNQGEDDGGESTEA